MLKRNRRCTWFPSKRLVGTVSIAVLVSSLLFSTPRAQALSGGVPLTPQEVLEQAEVIVVARVGGVLGSVPSPTGPAVSTLYLLQVESYLRPATPGPDSLIVSLAGGMAPNLGFNGPGLGGDFGPRDRPALFFLQRQGRVYYPLSLTRPVLPLDGDGIIPGAWVGRQPEFLPLLALPRHVAFRPPAVRLNGRRVGGEIPPRIESGRTLMPAAALADTLGVSMTQAEDGTLTLERGEVKVRLRPDEARLTVVGPGARRTLPLDVSARRTADGLPMVPLRAVASALGAAVDWQADAWTVHLRLPEGETPVPLTREEATARLLADLPDRFTVPDARYMDAWLDPRTGGERPVWVLTLQSRDAPYMKVYLDAVSGEHLLYQNDREGLHPDYLSDWN